MEDEQQQLELPEFGEVKALVRRRRWEFLLPFFLGWLVIWGASWLVQSTYRSGTLILVEQPSVPEKYVVPNVDADVQQQLDNITRADSEPHTLAAYHRHARALREGKEAHERRRSWSSACARTSKSNW